MYRIGIWPAAALQERVKLFSALADALGTRFEPLDAVSAANGLDAVIVFAEPDEAPDDAGPRRRLAFVPTKMSERAPARIAFGSSPELDPRLRGRTLTEDAMPPDRLAALEGDEVLATAGGHPVWLKRRRQGRIIDVVTGGPEELGDGVYLRDLASPGRMIGLLPLVHFLRELTANQAWTPPSPRASFVVDDPNLHWRSYGYVDYPELIRHARQHGYHIVMAMVPIDCWFAEPRTAHLFRENADVVSVCVHGNDHRKHDLAQPKTRVEALATLSSAMRRIVRFESRAGIGVSRVMVPPHESCSPSTMSAMAEVGFEAASATRPYLWVDFGTPPTPYNTPRPNHLLSGWHMTELMENGFPIMLRRAFHELEDAILRAFLDQPIILFGHQSDFADGLDQLQQSAAFVNSLPGVTWGPLSELSASNYEIRCEGTTLRLRPFARRVRVDVGPDVHEILIEPPGWVSGFDNGVDATFGGTSASVDGNVVRLPADRHGTVSGEIRWRPEREVAFGSVRGRPVNGRALVRRWVCEARDRIQPLSG